MSEISEKDASVPVSKGVESLIQRLHDQGVEAGRLEAEKIISEAEQKAALIKQQARRQAEQIVNDASKQAAAFKAAGQDALELAARDAHLKLRETIMTQFSDEVQRLVGKVMAPEPFMEKLILQVAGRVRDESGINQQEKLAIKLPSQLIKIDDLRKNPEELKEGTLALFVLSIMANLVQKEITYYPSDDINTGMKVYMKDGHVEVDLTDEAISAVLLQHLQPRFRALLEGIVK